MSETTDAEQTLNALITTMSAGAPDRAFNARRILAAIQRGEIPGVRCESAEDA